MSKNEEVGFASAFGSCRACPAPPASPDAGDCVCVCHKARERGEQRREMSRADRRGNMCLDGLVCDDGEPHRWVPVSFVFETQLLDDHGRVRIRQPSMKEGRVYMVCVPCRAHTYIVTEWAGYYLGGPDYSAIGQEDKAGNLPDDEAEPSAVGTAGGGQPNASDLGSVETQKGNTE